MGPLSSLSDQATWCQVISKIQKGPKPVAATLLPGASYITGTRSPGL